MSSTNKKRIILILIVVMLVSTFACTNNTESPDSINPTMSKDMLSANREFSFNMLKKLQEEDREKDIFISPISISTALTMAYEGASGITKAEMAEVLGYSEVEEALMDEFYQNMLVALNSYQNKIDLVIKNSLWFRQGEDINQAYLDQIAEIFDSVIRELDFNSDQAAKIMNGWIEEVTKGKIKDMLTSPLPQDAIMYLINAIYFKADWLYEFDEKDTFDTDFFRENDAISTVEMMNQKMTIPYCKDESLQVISLPYTDENLSMLVFLPSENSKIDGLIKDLNNDKFLNILEELEPYEDLIIQLPKFKIEYGTKLLNNSLKSLGMNEAFNKNADFSNIRDGIMISRVLHKSFIEVNEKGSEAATATVVEVVESAMENPEMFRADRPFVFMIYDNNLETILFLGKHS